MATALFHPGKIAVTAALHFEIEKQGMKPAALVPYLDRHVCGDWGEVDGHDKRVNQQALKSGARILSAYDMPSVGRIWIITDAAWTEDIGTRQVTTVMFPSDY